MERFQQAVKNWLRAQPGQPATITDLQALIDASAGIYNIQRPHRSLPGRAPRPPPAPPAQARAGDRASSAHNRVRTDRIDRTVLVTLRHNGRLHHIGTGRGAHG